jgi:2'-5' RNA ligase
MKAAFALLANHVIHNVVRKPSWEIHQKYGTGTRHASLPPHVSLKQPFGIKDLLALEEYMSELAGSIQPFEVTLTELQVIPVSFAGTAYGLLWIDVQETPELRNLHNRLNDELNQRFGHTPADFDGEQYHFHMTVMMGGQPVDVYRKFYSEIPDPRINLRFTAQELAMFVYDEPMGPTGEYLCYKILPIGI